MALEKQCDGCMNTSFGEALAKFHIISNFKLKNAHFVQTNGRLDMHTHALFLQLGTAVLGLEKVNCLKQWDNSKQLSP